MLIRQFDLFVFDSKIVGSNKIACTKSAETTFDDYVAADGQHIHADFGWQYIACLNFLGGAFAACCGVADIVDDIFVVGSNTSCCTTRTRTAQYATISIKILKINNRSGLSTQTFVANTRTRIQSYCNNTIVVASNFASILGQTGSGLYGCDSRANINIINLQRIDAVNNLIGAIQPSVECVGKYECIKIY